MRVRQVLVRTWKEPRWRYRLWEAMAESYSQDLQEMSLQVNEQGESEHQQRWPGWPTPRIKTSSMSPSLPQRTTSLQVIWDTGGEQ